MWRFETPARAAPMGGPGERLWGRYTTRDGVAVGVLGDGSVKQYTIVDPELHPEVTEWFQGGRVHLVGEATANLLTLAGYGPFLSVVVDA